MINDFHREGGGNSIINSLTPPHTEEEVGTLPFSPILPRRTSPESKEYITLAG